MRDGPPHREVQGHGRLVVVVGVTPHQGAEESSAQGEGAEVSAAERHAGVRDAQRLACRNASRFGGDQALESRVLGNGQALFGEGRTEKAWQQDLAGRLLYFLLGFSGPKVEAEEIKRQIGAFLHDTLKLELSADKTLITHAQTEAAHFLGYELVAQHADDKLDRRGQRQVNGMLGLRVPEAVITKKCSLYMRKGKPAQRAQMLDDSDYTIVSRYQAEYRGLVQYYLLAQNVFRLGKLRSRDGNLTPQDPGGETSVQCPDDGSTVQNHHRDSRGTSDLLPRHGPTWRGQKATGRAIRGHSSQTAAHSDPCGPCSVSGQDRPERRRQTPAGRVLRTLWRAGDHPRPPHPQARRPPPPRAERETRLDETHGDAASEDTRRLSSVP